MSLPNVPEKLTAKNMANNDTVGFGKDLHDFYNECLDKISQGLDTCAVNSEDIDIRIIEIVSKKLEDAGYEVKNSFDMFMIKNPCIRPYKKPRF